MTDQERYSQPWGYQIEPTEEFGLDLYRPRPTFPEAIEMAEGLIGLGGGDNREYVRGITELLIDLFAIGEGMDSRGDVETLISGKVDA